MQIHSSVHDSKQLVLNGAAGWALYAYTANELKLRETGDELDDLVDEFDETKILYAFVRVRDPISQLFKFVLITWCGEGVLDSRKAFFTAHANQVAAFFSGYHVQITARSTSDISPESILKKVEDSSGAKYSVHESARSSTTRQNDQSTRPSQTVPSRPSVTSVPSRPSVTSVPSRPSVSSIPSRPSAATTSNIPARPSQYQTSVPTQPPRQQESWDRDNSPSPPPISKPAPSKGLCGIVLYDYTPEQVNELKLIENEEIHNIEQIDDGWWLGVDVRGNKGVFPANYVELKEDKKKEEEKKIEIVKEERISDVRKKFEALAVKEPVREPIVREPILREPVVREPIVREPIVREPIIREPIEKEPIIQRPIVREPVVPIVREQQPVVQVPVAPIVPKAIPKVSPEIRGVALYDYDPEEPNEIAIRENETISSINKIDEGWWEGVNSRGERGLFPASYIQLLEDESTSVNKEPETKVDEGRTGHALYDCESMEPNEISFNEGEKIINIEFISEEWWEGTNCRGERGLFPMNYIELD